MKIILLEDVKSLGKKGDIIEASEGYARNFILPKKLGVEANGKNLNDLKLQKANEEKLAKEKYDEAVAFGKEMETKEVVVKMKAGGGRKSFWLCFLQRNCSGGKRTVRYGNRQKENPDA